MVRWLTLVLPFFWFNPIFSQKNQYYWYRAVAFQENGNIPMALAFIDSAISQSPRSTEYILKKGELLFMSGYIEESLEEFKKGDGLKPGTASLGIAKVYAAKRNQESAISELNRYLAGNEKISEARIKLDPAFAELSKTKAWDVLWRNEWYNANERFFAEVEYLFSRSKWDDAVDAISKRLDRSKGNHRLYALRGEAYYNLGSYKSAESDFTNAIGRSRRNPGYLHWRAKCRLALRQHRAAANDFELALELSGGNPKVLPGLARAYAGLDRLDDALSALKRYLAFYPDDIENQFLLGKISYENSLYLDALFAFGRVIRKGMATAECFELRGIIYTKSGSWDLALADFTRAIELQPERTSALHLRAETLIKQGKINQACYDLREAIDKGHFPSQELFHKYCRR